MTIGFDLPVADLRRVIRTVAPAATSDNLRPILCGVLVELDKAGVASFTASDSYRVHRATLAEPIEAGPFRALIPADWLIRWAKVPWPRAAGVELRIRSGLRVQLDVASDRVSTRTITEALDTRGQHFPDIDTLYDLTGPDEGTAAFNPRYLRGVFDAAHIWSDTYPIRTVALNPLKPCRFTVIDPTHGTLDMLLMPVRIPPTKSDVE